MMDLNAQLKKGSLNMEAIAEKLVELGAYKAAVLPVADIVFDPSFRLLCEQNACGHYGKCWMCPPDAGEINTLIAKARAFTWAAVYQTVGQLEDSYDIEGMTEAAQRHNDLAQLISQRLAGPGSGTLHLGAGGCRVCPVCAKRTGEPCRFPDRAMASLETYGVAVSQLAESCGMKYINGQNTVTYFGALLY